MSNAADTARALATLDLDLDVLEAALRNQVIRSAEQAEEFEGRDDEIAAMHRRERGKALAALETVSAANSSRQALAAAAAIATMGEL